MQLTTLLKDFQTSALKRTIELENKYDGGLLLLEAGLGKSIIMLATIINNPVKTLVICPAGLVDNWISEIKKHTNISDGKIVKYYGQNRKSTVDGLIYITSYSIVSREFNGQEFKKTSIFSDNSIIFERIILDEAHYIRNTYSGISKSINFLGESYRINIKKWIVTATPIFNDINDAFSYFKFLQLEGIDTKSDWTKSINKSIDGMERLNVWMEKYGINLLKQDVLKELKPKLEEIITLEFSDIESEFYNALKDYSHVRMKNLTKRMNGLNTFKDIGMKKILTSNVMVYILRLKQACNSPLIVLKCMSRLKGHNLVNAISKLKFYNESVNIVDECPICYDSVANFIAEPCGHKCCERCWNKMFNQNITSCPKCREYVDDIKEIRECVVIDTRNEKINLSDFKSSVKIQKAIQMTKNIILKDEKIVIVSQWISMLDIMRHIFKNDPSLSDIKFVSLQGNVTLEQRTMNISNFQNDKSIKVCFVSLMSSSEGFNLTASNNVIFLDSWWNNSKMSQAMDRTHRIGQLKKVNIYKLQVDHTIEQQIEKLVDKKQKISNLVTKKWEIKDKENYDMNWMNDTIQLIENPIDLNT